MPESGLWDRLSYKEHASAYGSISASGKTEYIQIIRIVHSQPATKEELAVASARKMAYKTFTPARLKKPGSGGEPEELSEASYEDLRMVEEKVNAWMEFSGE